MEVRPGKILGPETAPLGIDLFQGPVHQQERIATALLGHNVPLQRPALLHLGVFSADNIIEECGAPEQFHGRRAESHEAVLSHRFHDKLVRGEHLQVNELVPRKALRSKRPAPERDEFLPP